MLKLQMDILIYLFQTQDTGVVILILAHLESLQIVSHPMQETELKSARKHHS